MQSRSLMFVLIGSSLTASPLLALTVANPSFESPDVTTPISTNPLVENSGVSPGATSWNAPVTNQNAGVFTNLPADTEYNLGTAQNPIYVDAHRVNNAVGNQLGYLGAINDGVTPNEFYQTLGDTFAAGSQYTLSVGVTTSSVQPPSADAKLSLQFYYLNGPTRVLLGTPTLITEAQALGADDHFLKYFTVNSPVISSGAGSAIGILISTANGTGNTANDGGTFDVDDVTVTVPEPASISAGLFAGALLMRRRARGK